MRTEDLIADLARRAAPVRPLPSPRVRVLAWVAVAAASVAIGIGVFGARSDLAALVRQPEFLILVIVAFGIATLAAAASLVLAIPGAERSPALRGSTMALLGCWAALLVAGVIREGQGLAAVSHWPVCFVRVAAIGIIPGLVLFTMLRRAAPLRLAWTSSLAAMAALAAGALAIQFICPLDDPGHALLGHFGPVSTLGALGAAAAPRLLRWHERRWM